MINPFGDHLLNVIAYLPLLGGLVILLAFRKDQKTAVARFATLVAAIDLLISLVLWIDWWKVKPGDYGYRFVQKLPWVESFGTAAG